MIFLIDELDGAEVGMERRQRRAHARYMSESHTGWVQTVAARHDTGEWPDDLLGRKIEVLTGRDRDQRWVSRSR